MEPDKAHIRHCISFCYNLKKNASETQRFICEAYDDGIISIHTCQEWFQRFRSGNFDLSDKERSGRSKNMSNDELQALLDQDSAQSVRELAALGVHFTVSERLHTMGKIQKDWEMDVGNVGNGFHMNSQNVRSSIG